MNEKLKGGLFIAGVFLMFILILAGKGVGLLIWIFGTGKLIDFLR
jgi:hypothetical protein